MNAAAALSQEKLIADQSVSKKSRPPRQDRSVQTREKILDACERLLKHKPWDEISIQQIVVEAGCTNGAVYGRFKSKDDLLIELYSRHDQRLKDRYLNRKAKNEQKKVTIEEQLKLEIDRMVDNFRKNRWLLREMGLLSRIKPDVVTDEMRSERKRIFDRIVDGIMKYFVNSDSMPKRREIEHMVFFVSTCLREVLLYPGPHSDSVGWRINELKAAVHKMALGYLGIEQDGSTKS